MIRKVEKRNWNAHIHNVASLIQRDTFFIKAEYTRFVAEKFQPIFEPIF